MGTNQVGKELNFDVDKIVIIFQPSSLLFYKFLILLLFLIVSFLFIFCQKKSRRFFTL